MGMSITTGSDCGMNGVGKENFFSIFLGTLGMKLTKDRLREAG
jgi:hypothetical protein